MGSICDSSKAKKLCETRGISIKPGKYEENEGVTQGLWRVPGIPTIGGPIEHTDDTIGRDYRNGHTRGILFRSSGEAKGHGEYRGYTNTLPGRSR